MILTVIKTQVGLFIGEGKTIPSEGIITLLRPIELEVVKIPIPSKMNPSQLSGIATQYVGIRIYSEILTISPLNGTFVWWTVDTEESDNPLASLYLDILKQNAKKVSH